MREEVEAEVREEVKQSEVNLVLRQLARRLGRTVPPEIEAQVRSLSFTQLESLGEALLDFSTVMEIEDWFQRQRD